MVPVTVLHPVMTRLALWLVIFSSIGSIMFLTITTVGRHYSCSRGGNLVPDVFRDACFASQPFALDYKYRIFLSLSLLCFSGLVVSHIILGFLL